MGLLSAVAALFACDEGPASNLTFTSTPDVWSFVTGIGASGPLLVAVHGNPFREPADMISREVVRAIAGTFTEPWLHFTDREGDAASKDARLIWLLDPQEGFNADLACAGELPPPAAGRRVMELRAVFCQRGRPLSAVHGWMRRPDSAADPRWRNLVSQMSRQLLSGRG